MGLLTFKGGAHPDDGKRFSKEAPLKKIGASGEFVFLLSQHIGAPAKPIVEKGSHISPGQIIAEASGFMSSNICSSVSGVVKEIAPRISATGAMVNAIVVTPDEEQEDLLRLPTKNSLDEWSAEEIIKRVGDAGIVGMGGAGFPTHVKLSPQDRNKIDYVIVNGAECEPYITCDYRRMIENPEEIILGLKAILKTMPNAKGVIGIEDNKPFAISTMEKACKGEERISVAALKTKYPQGGERQLIKAITGRALNYETIPPQMGCIVDNVETVYAIYNAVYNGIPLVSRTITISGDGVENPSNLIAPIGMNQTEIIKISGGYKKDEKGEEIIPEKIISGGPMMGFAMMTSDTPLTKTSSAFLAFKHDEISSQPTTPCINCGRCIGVCPSKLVPCTIAKLANDNEMAQFVTWNGLECIECGCCSFECPAKRPLKQSIAGMKKETLGAIRSGDFVVPKKNKKKEAK